MKKLLLASLLTLPFLATAQIFQKVYTATGGAKCIRQTYDGGFILCGAGSPAILVKTNANGDTLWTRTFNALGKTATSISQTGDSGYVSCGMSFAAFTSIEMHIIRHNKLGDTLWTRTLSGANAQGAHSVQQTSDGGFIVAGYNQALSGFHDAYLVKLSASGTVVWDRNFFFGSNSQFNEVRENADGTLICVGDLMNAGNIVLVKTSALGDTIWSKSIGSLVPSYGYSVRQTPDKGFIICGLSGNSGLSSPCLIKTDSMGNVSWWKDYRSTLGLAADGRCVEVTADGGYLLAANTADTAQSSDALLIRTDANGDTLWSSHYGLSYTGAGQQGNYVCQTSDGGFALAGNYSHSGIVGAYLVKTDSAGGTSCYQMRLPRAISSPVIYAGGLHPQVLSGINVKHTSLTTSRGSQLYNECILTAIEKMPDAAVLNVYPNPSSGQFTISGAQVIEELKVHDALGRIVYCAKPGEKNVMVKLEAEGMYFVEVRLGGQVAMKKIFVRE